MKYIKWLYLAVWTLIYQLPAKTIRAFSTMIITIATIFGAWLLFSQEVAVGNINSIQVLPDGYSAVVNVEMISQAPKHIIIKTSELPKNVDEYNWFIGYGRQLLDVDDSTFLIVEHSNMVTNPLSLKTDLTALVYESLNSNKKIMIAIGVVLVLFALIFIQISSALLMGMVTLAICWHALNIGNFYGYWSFSDGIILPVSFLFLIVGSAIGMRNNEGKSAFILHRISAAILFVILIPYFQNILSTEYSGYIYWLILVWIFIPEVVVTILGAQLIAHGLEVNHYENMVITTITSVFTIWVHRHYFAKTTSRPFKKVKTSKNGEMILDPSHF